MPSAMRLVRSGLLLATLSFTAPTIAGGTHTLAPPCAAPAATETHNACASTHAAVMDLWLATSLGLLLLYYRRRRRMRR